MTTTCPAQVLPRSRHPGHSNSEREKQCQNPLTIVAMPPGGTGKNHSTQRRPFKGAIDRQEADCHDQGQQTFFVDIICVIQNQRVEGEGIPAKSRIVTVGNKPTNSNARSTAVKTSNPMCASLTSSSEL